MKTHLIRYLPIILALAFLAQGYFGSLQKSLTWDEPVFIASGYSYLIRGDFRMNPEAPPLLQMLVALPLLPLNLTLISQNHPIWQKASHIAFGKHFIQANVQHLTTLTRLARLPILLLGTLLVITIFIWGTKLYGPIPALCATTLAVFSPNLLAHAKLATTDLGCTAFMFFAVFAFWRVTRSLRWPAWFLCGFVTGLALLTKYTALLLGPIYLIYGLIGLYQKKIAFSQLAAGAGIIASTALLVIGVGYGFSFNPLHYLHGLEHIYANASPDYRFYLHGNVSETPWWYYYLTAFVIKTPAPTLLLLGLATASLILQKDNREAAFFLLIPPVLILTVTCFDQANLGYRRILPALPFLLLFCAHTFTSPLVHWRTAIATLLFIWTLFNAGFTYPHHLSYINTFFGGSTRGPYLLDDSNIDWGQDLPGLANWEQKHPEARPLRLLYFGILPPSTYNVSAHPLSERAPDIVTPKPGYYAISAHNLVHFRKLKARYGFDIDWLTKYTPIDHIGYSIYIYKFQ